MRRTTVFLPDELKAALERTAAANGKSEAEVIRDALAVAAQTSLLDEVERGAYALAPFSANDVADARAIIERHADLGVSLADASIAVLASRHDVGDVLTLDEPHFRGLVVDGKPLRLLPADT